MQALAAGRRGWLPLLAGLLSLAGLVGCGGDRAPQGDHAGPAAAESAAGAGFAASLDVDLTQMTKLPSGLYYRDLVAGEGTVVAPGQFVAAKYTGWLTNGTQFDATGPNGTPYVFKIGAGQVIKGWDEGLLGMKVGGVRQLVVPAELGYGAQGSAPDIPPNAVLVFRVEVVSAD